MLFLLFVFFLISSAFLVNKYLAFFLAPDLFVTLRMGISGILLLLIASLTTFIPSLLRAFALKNIMASRAAFWGAFEPFIASFYLYILYNEHMNKYQIIGCLLSCFSCAFFLFMQTKENIFTGAIFCLADIAQIGSLCISRFGWIKGQELMRKDIFSPQQLNAFCFTISGFLSLSLFIMRNGKLDSLWPLCNNYSFLLAFLYTVVIGNMVAYNLYAYALKHTVVTYVSIAGLSMPLFVHILSVLFFNEALSPSFFISIFLIAIALYIFQHGKEK